MKLLQAICFILTVSRCPGYTVDDICLDIFSSHQEFDCGERMEQFTSILGPVKHRLATLRRTVYSQMMTENINVESRHHQYDNLFCSDDDMLQDMLLSYQLLMELSADLMLFRSDQLSHLSHLPHMHTVLCTPITYLRQALTSVLHDTSNSVHREGGRPRLPHNRALALNALYETLGRGVHLVNEIRNHFYNHYS